VGSTPGVPSQHAGTRVPLAAGGGMTPAAAVGASRRPVWQLAFALLGGRAAAGPTKEVISNVQCEVCRLAMGEAMEHAEEKGIKDEDGLADLIDGLCSVKKDQGKWVSKIDIKKQGDSLTLHRQELVGFCKSECLSVQRACTASLKDKEEDIIELMKTSLKEEKGADELKAQICKKPCGKKLPKLKNFVDEPFKPRDPKEVEAEDRVKKMEAETGQKFKMWSRDEISSMSEADIQLEAAKDALGAARREEKLKKQMEAGEL